MFVDRDPGPEHTDKVKEVADLVLQAIAATQPTETEEPGIKSLVTAGLLLAAGYIMRGIPDHMKASAVAHFQQFLSDAVYDNRQKPN